ncbi:MAG: AFG1 family ATPase [Alphaproteobacteria bacterium]|nr:AFG1 family ATPase [Alphaproteobacteria bacterium]
MSNPGLISRYKELVSQGALRPDPGQERAMLALADLQDRLMVKPRARLGLAGILGRLFRQKISFGPKGLYIHGGVGRGKSMLMDMFYETLGDEIPKRRVHFHEFMIGIHDSIHSWRIAVGATKGRRSVEGLLPVLAAMIARESRVLCFDEFHVRDIADAMILARLFRALFERGVVVVATSNWPPDRLYEDGLQRDRFLPFIGLLKERMAVLPLDGMTDYRNTFTTLEGAYFSPLGKESATHADRLFEKLTGQSVAGEAYLTVRGRKILVHAARGVARFTFSQLCEQPYGAEDYLKIAQTYHTVFLENIPTLGYDRRNEAKRFMNLIDVFYEAGTRLIVTAAVPAERLYRGHDHAFEFERTVSRLREMQSAAYLSRSGGDGFEGGL